MARSLRAFTVPQSTTSGFRKHFLNSLAIALAVALGCKVASLFVPHGPRTALEGARASLNYPVLESEYAKLIDADVYDLDNHRGLIDAHLSIPRITRTRHSTTVRDDSQVQGRYEGYVQSSDARLRDIGLYGMGYFFSREGEPDRSLEYFDKIAHRDIPYLNNSLGYIYWHHKGQPDRARAYFEREIALNGNVSGAVTNLAELFWEQRKLVDMDALSRDAVLSGFFPLHELRYLELAQRRFGGYLGTLLRSEVDGMTWPSLLSSLLIALMFLAYIYFVDVFEKERISLLAAVFGMGVLSGVFASMLYDLNGAFLGISETGRWAEDLRFYVLVGLIEETAKAIPVLIALFVWRKWNESVDLFVFAGASALGFACIENVAYFSRVAIGLIVGRSLSAVVMHVCLTSLAVYGLFRRRYVRDTTGALWPLGCFGAAVLAHGLYDFFIASPQGLGMLSTFILIYLILVYRNMMENALNQSEYFAGGTFKISLSLYLFYGILGVLLLQFSILAVQYGLELSLWNLGLNMLRFYFLCFFLVMGFGNLALVKHKWRSILSRQR